MQILSEEQQKRHRYIFLSVFSQVVQLFVQISCKKERTVTQMKPHDTFFNILSQWSPTILRSAPYLSEIEISIYTQHHLFFFNTKKGISSTTK